MTDKKYKILYLIHTPPPVHGVSVICNQVYTHDFEDLQLSKKLIKLNLSRSFKELRHLSFLKIFRLIAIGFKLLFQLLFFRPDLVYFSIMPVGKGFIKDFLLVILLKIFRTNIVYHLHNKGIPGYVNKWGYKTLYKVVFRNCSIIHLSEQLLEKELHAIKENNVKLFVVPNGIYPLKQYAVNKDNTEITILFFSNLIPEKGYLVSLKSIRKLIERNHKNIRLIIAGNPTHAASKSIDNYLKEYPEIKNQVDIRGAAYDEEKALLYHKADIFIFPSRFSQECMPLVILDALSVGLPIVASNIGAIPDMLVDEKNGFLIPPGDDEILTDKIEIFLKNQNLIRQFGNESFRLYQEKFTQNHFFRNMENIFKKIIIQEK